MVQNLPAMREIEIQSLGQEDPLEKGMATHSIILVWRIPWTEKPVRLQSTGSQRVRHDWCDLAHMHTMYYCQFLLNIRKIWNSLSLYIESLSNLIPIMPMDHFSLYFGDNQTAAAAAKSLQSCPTLCDPVDSSPPGSPVPGILQTRTLEWVAISFSNAWKWNVKVKSLSRVRLLVTHGLQPTRLFRPWDFPGKSTGVGCRCLLR